MTAHPQLDEQAEVASFRDVANRLRAFAQAVSDDSWTLDMADWAYRHAPTPTARRAALKVYRQAVRVICAEVLSTI